MKIVKVRIFDEDGDLLDSATIELSDHLKHIAVRPVSHSIGKTEDEIILDASRAV